MKEHTFLSLFRDLKAFIGIKKERLAAIEKAPLSPVEGSFGVNKLAKQLHPDKVLCSVSAVKEDNFGNFLILSSIDKEPLPPCKNGQYVTVRPANSANKFSRSLFIAGENAGEYAIFVPRSEDESTERIRNAKKGELFYITSPDGFCVYEPLRDSSTVFVCCDKFGYGAASSFVGRKINGVSVRELNLMNGLAELKNKASQLELFIKEVKLNNASLFIYGSEEFVVYVKTMSEKAGIIRKSIRYEIITPALLSAGDNEKKYVCRVKTCDGEFNVLCREGMTLAASFEYAGVPCNIRCMSGSCGYCRMRLVDGEIETCFPEGETPVRMADEKHGFIHPCRSYPRSDLTVLM